MTMSLAMKYAMKKRKKMYDGGEVSPTSTATIDADKAAKAAASMKKAFNFSKGGMCSAHGMADCGECMAEGGDVEEDRSSTRGGVHADISRKEWGGGARRGTSIAGEHVRAAKKIKDDPESVSYIPNFDDATPGRIAKRRTDAAKEQHHKALGKLKDQRRDRTNLAEGGEVDDDLVSRAMRSRKGEPVADFEENDFDYSHQRPVPDDDYTDENSGDELGDEAEDDDRSDIVLRIMRSRAKKDKMPRPA